MTESHPQTTLINRSWLSFHILLNAGVWQNVWQANMVGLLSGFTWASVGIISLYFTSINAYGTITYETLGRTENPCVGGSNPPLPIFISPCRLNTYKGFLFWPFQLFSCRITFFITFNVLRRHENGKTKTNPCVGGSGVLRCSEYLCKRLRMSWTLSHDLVQRNGAGHIRSQTIWPRWTFLKQINNNAEFTSSELPWGRS